MRKHRLIPILPFCLLLLLPAAVLNVLGQTPQRPIELADIMAWKGISATALSDNGEWFGYRIGPAEGDSEVVWFEGNYQDYEVDRHRRLGASADQPHRIKYRKLTR